MKKVFVIGGLVLFVAMAMSACKAHKPCDAYGKAGEVKTSPKARA